MQTTSPYQDTQPVLLSSPPLVYTTNLTKPGAYSVFHQLAYDLRQPQSTSIIKQACIWSNGPGVQPKNKTDAQTQFNQLLSALNISPSLPASAKLSILRTAPPKTLIDAAASIQIHQFRPSTDNTFISASLFQSLDDGSFASALKARNIRILLGECRDEHSLYGIWHPPPENNIPSLRNRLLADYPAPIVDALIPLYTPTSGPDAGKLPPGFTNWGQDGFGRIYADMQVHALQRGLIHSLSVAGASHLLYRYRIEYRLSCVDESLPPEWGVTHTADMPIWFFGNGVGKVNEGREREIVKKGILDPFTKFINGDAAIGWGTEGCRQVRTLRSDGEVVIWEDGLWDWALRVWGTLRRVDTLGSRSGSGSGGRSAKL